MASNIRLSGSTRPVAFSPLRSDLPPPHHSRHKQILILRKLIDVANEHRSIDSFRELKAFIDANQDLELVSTILNEFLRCEIPSSVQQALSNPAHIRHVKYAMGSVLDILLILAAMLIERTPRTTALLKCYFQDILEGWSQILRWLNVLVDLSSSSSNSGDMLSAGTDLMLCLSGALVSTSLEEENRLLLQDLFEIPATGNFVLRLFTHHDPEQGARLIHISRTIGCRVITTLANYMADPRSFGSLVNTLQKNKYALVEALIQRAVDIENIVAREILETGGQMLLPLSKSFTLLVSCSTKLAGIPAIRKLLLKKQFAYALSNAFSNIYYLVHEFQKQSPPFACAVEMQEFWTEAVANVAWIIDVMVSSSCLNPVKIFPSIVKGGFIYTAILLFHHSHTPPELLQVLRPCVAKCISLLTLPRAVTEDYHIEYPRNLGMQELVELTTALQNFLNMGDKVARQIAGGKKAMLCSNINHVDHNQDSFRMCGRCHSVTYCSKQCQREDWAALHRQECAAIRRIYTEAKQADIWISLSERQQYLLWLEHVAEDLLGPCLAHMYNTPNIGVFDFASYEGLSYKCRYPLQQYIQKCWVGLESFWRPRMLTMVNDAKLAPTNGAPCILRKDSPIFLRAAKGRPSLYFAVEGIFPFKEDTSIFLLAIMRMNRDASFKAISSMWRLGTPKRFESARGSAFYSIQAPIRFFAILKLSSFPFLRPTPLNNNVQPVLYVESPLRHPKQLFFLLQGAGFSRRPRFTYTSSSSSANPIASLPLYLLSREPSARSRHHCLLSEFFSHSERPAPRRYVPSSKDVWKLARCLLSVVSFIRKSAPIVEGVSRVCSQKGFFSGSLGVFGVPLPRTDDLLPLDLMTLDAHTNG
ncbi:hypothetical protein NMY22_g4921 [Coprinellus aureogranulatus]|nr:hypothetical protein NMY22_g4921 [Coprinellus aureogranulatus]